MKVNFDKDNKVVKVGFFPKDKEDVIQRWVFIQIFRPGTIRFELNSLKKEENIFELAFNE